MNISQCSLVCSLILATRLCWTAMNAAPSILATNHAATAWCITFNRVDRTQRHTLLKPAIGQGRALGVQRYLIAALSDEVKKEAEGREEALIDAATLDDLKACWLEGLRTKVS